MKCAIGGKSQNGGMKTSTSTFVPIPWQTKRRVTSKAGIDGMVKLSRLFASGDVPYASHENPKVADFGFAHLEVGEWIKTGNLYPASAYRHVIQGSDDAEAVGEKLEGMLQ